jgi:hypothetical protein
MVMAGIISERKVREAGYFMRFSFFSLEASKLLQGFRTKSANG